MRLGILQTGEINPMMGDGLPTYEDMFSNLFNLSVPEVDLTYIKVLDNEFPASVDEYDAYLVTGSPSGVYDDDVWIAPLMDFIREAFNAKKKLIGICFGHQVIAEALGGKAEKSDKGWGVGVRSVDVTSHAGLIPDQTQSFNLLYMHQDQVTKLPPSAEVLASDEFCPIAAFKINDQVLCLQGHPEFTPEVIDSIIDFRRDQIGEDTSAKGQASLSTPHEGIAVGKWFRTFLNDKNVAQSPSS